MDLTGIYRVFHPAAAQYTLFSTDHGTFSKMDILGHKRSLNNYKKIEIIPSILSDRNGIKLELKNKRNYRKYSNTWRLNNILLNDQWATKEIKVEIKTVSEMKMKTQPTKNYGIQQRQY
jgi:hypothetical protein